MKQHLLILVLLLSTNTNLLAQNLQLENSWKKDSKFLYIGVENRLIIKGRSANSVRSENASCRIAGDTLFIYPKILGPLTIEIHTADQTYYFSFISKYLDLPNVTISGAKSEGTLLRKDDAANALIKVSSVADGETLYDNYLVTGFAIQIAGIEYYVQGNQLTKDIQVAIGKLSPEDYFSVEKVSLKNKENGLPLAFVLSTKFKVNQD